MREEQHLQNLYSKPDAKQKRSPVEQQLERYYALLRLKLSPRKLKGVSKFNVIAIVGMIFLLCICALLLPKPTESALEKRKLAEKPDFSVEGLFDGTFTRKVELYFSDTFPAREWMVSLSAVVNESKGVRFDDVRILAPAAEQPAASIATDSNGNAEPEDSAQSTPETSAQSEQDGASDENSSQPEDETINVSNGTFVYKGMAMSLFGGSPKSGDSYADVLNGYQEQLPGVQIYNMLIPTSIEFYVPDKYRDLTGSQKAMIDRIYSRLNAGIKKVDAYSQLEAHKDEYLYFRTDHHWTGLGAYYAYTAFCQQAGLTPISLADTETRRLDQFIGTMYSQTQDSTLLKNPDYVDYYIFKQPYTAVRYEKGAPYTPIPHTLWGEYAKSPNSYSVFLHGDFPLISVKTGIPNGKKILVVKESFGNAFAPYLINHYEEVHIVDQRYYELSMTDFIKKNGINELVFVNNTFAACTKYHIQCINNLRYHSFVPESAVVKDVEEEETAEVMADASSDADKKSAQSSKNASRNKNTSGDEESTPDRKIPADKKAGTGATSGKPSKKAVSEKQTNAPQSADDDAPVR